MTRRDFVVGAAAAWAFPFGPGCTGIGNGKAYSARIALQLYSLYQYIGGRDAEGKPVCEGVGLAKAMADVAAIGYTGVEVDDYYGHSAKEIRKMLDDNGLVAVGTHVGGWKAIAGDKLKRACEFNLGFGNDILICPGGTGPDDLDWDHPTWNARTGEHLKFITEFFNRAAETAKACGCRVGVHNHQWEFQLKDPDGKTYWDHFFEGTTQDVLMEQDVGWTTCAGYDPCEQYRKYPGRSPLLHAKENGMGKGVTSFEGILGQPGRPGARGVDWDRLLPVTEANGTKWYVVECERHFNDLSAVGPSYAFLRSKGLC